MLPEGEDEETFFMHANGNRVPYFLKKLLSQKLRKLFT